MARRVVSAFGDPQAQPAYGDPQAQASGLQQSVDKINQAYDNLGTALSS
jgi:hypothetical protein